MKTIVLPQMLIISGTERKSGKTTLVCNIIRKFSPHKSIIAFKITPHFHKNIKSGKVLIDNERLYIAEETDSSTGKDSSLMLKAGAQQSYFVMVTDDHLDEAFREIMAVISSDKLLICESGGLRHHVIPGLFFMMKKAGTVSLKPGAEQLMPFADQVITYDGKTIHFDINRIEIADNQWTLKQK
jgi:hypothetical protein